MGKYKENGICMRKFEDPRLHKRDRNDFFRGMPDGNKDFTRLVLLSFSLSYIFVSSVISFDANANIVFA